MTWTATDSSGNISTATQNIVMGDLNPPTITAPEDIEISTEKQKMNTSFLIIFFF